jgi:GT2 family glycosyltransferase
VPNWNGKEHLGDCLRSLLRQSVKARILVVDNGSKDGSVEYIKQKFPEVETIELDKNYGFAGGVNRGIGRAMEEDVEFVALFNNDAVAQPSWLEELLAAAKQHEKAGIITGKLLRADKEHIDSTGEFYTTWGMPFPRGRNEIDEGQYDKGEYVFGATGGASLYRTALFKDIGLFDEDFFAYFEDVDISFRTQLVGWKVRYTPKAIAYHQIGGTSRKMGNFTRYHSVKNAALLYDKNMPGTLFWKYKLLFLIQLFRMFLGSVRDGQVGTYFKALGRIFLLMPRLLKKRRHVQKRRKLSNSELSRMLRHGPPPKVSKL